MPMYLMKCPVCETQINRKLSFAQYDAVKAGDELQPCTACDKGGMLEFVFSPGNVGFVLRDGIHGGWISKASRENKYRGKRRIDMARKEKDHVFKSKLIPNFEGNEASSWKDVQDEVRTKRGEESAQTYEPLVKQERRAS